MLAANIGGGSTVGATGLGYRDGLAAVWWVGSAAVGSIVLALWIGPAMRRVAAEHDLRTVGDFLEYRFGVAVRTAIAGAAVGRRGLHPRRAARRHRHHPRRDRRRARSCVGCVIGGLLITIYFTAGGLLTSAWVNVVQLIGQVDRVLRSRCRWRSSAVGGWPALRGACIRRRTTGTCGTAADPGWCTSRCSAPRSSSRRGCCRRSTAPATIARCGSASG